MIVKSVWPIKDEFGFCSWEYVETEIFMLHSKILLNTSGNAISC